MVVAEALACGTPAIVSNQTGAKAMLEQFSGAGWVVECDVNSLCDQIRRLIQNPDLVFAARQEAFKAATHFTWAAYRQRTGDFFQACCHAV
jgi:glycosyltransferase involved in cell wall biosynthesis